MSAHDIEKVLGKPKTPDDLVEDARWWLRELGGPLPEASPLFKALCQVVRENDRLREGYCSEAYILMVQALDVKALGKGRRRILTEQALRMAAVGLRRGAPRAPGVSAVRLAEDVLAQLAPTSDEERAA